MISTTEAYSLSTFQLLMRIVQVKITAFYYKDGAIASWLLLVF